MNELEPLLICNRCDHVCTHAHRDVSMPPSDCPNCYGGQLKPIGGRLMSVSFTADAVLERRKTVTRRVGWRFLKRGDRLQLCRKVMGRNGAPLERLAYVRVVDVRRERLSAITDDDIVLEGVRQGETGDYAERHENGTPTVAAFVEWFCDEMGVDPYDDVTRIEWRYVDASTSA